MSHDSDDERNGFREPANFEEMSERWELSRDDYERISTAMSAYSMSFVEAALSLGIRRRDRVEVEVHTRASRLPVSVPGHTLLRAQFLEAPGLPITVADQGHRTLGKSLLPLLEKRGARSIQIASLRTDLLMKERKDGALSVLAVLSAGSREGRSQLVAELAVSYAQLGGRVLLVDGDMRAPAQKKLFPAALDWREPRQTHESETAWVTRIDSMPNLHVVLQLRESAEPLEILTDGRLARMMQLWEEEYDHIIIDTPPASLFKDALAIAGLARSVILIGRANVSRYGDLDRLQRNLRAAGVTIAGAVLNRF